MWGGDFNVFKNLTKFLNKTLFQNEVKTLPFENAKRTILPFSMFSLFYSAKTICQSQPKFGNSVGCPEASFSANLLFDQKKFMQL